jgi:hypothetical protein
MGVCLLVTTLFFPEVVAMARAFGSISHRICDFLAEKQKVLLGHVPIPAVIIGDRAP